MTNNHLNREIVKEITKKTFDDEIDWEYLEDREAFAAELEEYNLRIQEDLIGYILIIRNSKSNTAVKNTMLNDLVRAIKSSCAADKPFKESFLNKIK